MTSEIITGIGILVFTYSLFSWALGKFINKRKDKKVNEFQNFLAGAWILGLIIAFFTVYLYFG